MPPSVNSMRKPVSPLIPLAGLFILVDAMFGTIIVLAGAPSHAKEVLLSVSFLLGLPAYFFDLWLKRRVAFALLSLFVLRWLARCFLGPHIALNNPFAWPIGLFLFLAFVCVQAAKWRER